MIKQSTKPKRGQKFIYQGKPVWIEILKPNGRFLVCDSEERSLTDNYFEVKLSDLLSAPEKWQSISKQPKKLTDKQKTESQLLNEFFEGLKIPFNCQECNSPLYAHSKFFRRCVSCHILPKGLFPSIACNPDNILFMGASLLGVCTDHEKWDGSIDSRIKMKVYQIALQRYELLKPFLSPKELIMADKYLGL